MTRLFTKGKRRGQAILEFALILPLILILVGGVVDFGVYMFQREQAGACVRTVARKASVRKITALSITESPQCTTASNKGGGPNLTLDPAFGAGYMTAPAGTNVRATITYSYTPVLLGVFVPGISMPVNASVAMRMEAGG